MIDQEGLPQRCIFKNQHNHDPLGEYFEFGSKILDIHENRRLEPEVKSAIMEELRSGKKPKDIYRNQVRNAPNPLDSLYYQLVPLMESWLSLDG